LISSKWLLVYKELILTYRNLTSPFPIDEYQRIVDMNTDDDSRLLYSFLYENGSDLPESIVHDIIAAGPTMRRMLLPISLYVNMRDNFGDHLSADIYHLIVEGRDIDVNDHPWSVMFLAVFYHLMILDEQVDLGTAELLSLIKTTYIDSGYCPGGIDDF
jgi:hypothetical protein